MNNTKGIQALMEGEPKVQERSPEGQIFSIESEINNLMKSYDMVVRNQDFDRAQIIADQIDMLEEQKINIQSDLADQQISLDRGIQNFANGGISSFVPTGLNPYPTAYGPQKKPGINEAVDEGQIDLEEFDNEIFNLKTDPNNPYNNTDLEPIMEIDPDTGATILTGYKDSSGNDVSIEDGMEIEEKASNRDLIRTGLSNFTNMMPDTPQMQQGRLVNSSLGTGASKVNFKDGGYAGQGIQGFFMGGMPNISFDEEEYIYGDDPFEFGPGGFDIDQYIRDNLGGGGYGGGYTPPTEEDLAEARAGRISQGYGGGGGSGIGGLGSYSDTRPGASISVDAKDKTPESYKFYPSEVSKLYSQMKGVPFSPLVAPPKEATYIDDLKPRRIKSQLYAADGKFVDRSELITGPGGERGDKIPAMLSDGEFVVNAEAVRGMGVAAGADPEDEYQQRLEGARQMYALQKEGEQMMRKYR